MKKTSESRLSPRDKVGYAATGIAALIIAYFGFGEPKLRAPAPLGVATSPVDATTASKKGLEQYSKAYSSLSPAEKFTFQYASSVDVRVDATSGGTGLVGALTEGAEDYRVTINNGCLDRSAYDIDGGQITGIINGLFVRGEVEGDVPTAGAFAQIEEGEPDTLTIASGNAEGVDLTFTGAAGDGPLTPANDATQRILETYGCSVGITNTQLEAHTYLDQDGLY
jgi:hypothetical protein